MYVFRFYSDSLLYCYYPFSFKSRKYNLQKKSKGEVITLVSKTLNTNDIKTLFIKKDVKQQTLKSFEFLRI